MRMRTQILISMGAIIVVTSLIFSCSMYFTRKADLLNGVDEKLLTAAESMNAILPINYHDSIVDSGSVSKQTFEAIVDTNNKLCLNLGLEYLWSLMLIDGKIVFTSATSPCKDVSKGDHASFFDTHTNPEAYALAFSTMEVQKRTIVDQWGHTRVILVPKLDANGRKFLFGASMKTTDVQTLLMNTMKSSALFAGGFILLGILLSVALAGSFSRPVVKLTSLATDITNGDLNRKVDVGGSLEIKSLSRSLSDMTRSIREKVTELSESSERFKTLLDSFPTAIVVFNLHGDLEYINSKFIEIFGYELEDIPTIDAWWPKAYPEKEYREKVKQEWSDAMAKVSASGEQSKVQEWCVTSKNGQKLDIRFLYASIGDRGIVILEDITKQNRLEYQLVQSQKMEAIGTLSSGIAHDFNNLLQAILGYTQLMLTDNRTDRDFQNLSRIENAAKSAGKLVQQILLFSRKGESKLTPLKLNDEVKKSVHMLERTIPKMIRIECSLSSNLKRINGDANQIDQILMNLGTNARDAMVDGGTLTIETENLTLSDEYCSRHLDTTPGLYVLLRVSDTGTGMDEEQARHIFEPFYTTKKIGEGTGLGLSTVYGIIRNHKGKIQCYTELGKGTVFNIYFPAISNEQDEDGVFSHPTDLVRGGDETILVVDDDEMIRDLMRATLEPHGYDVVFAHNGEEAIDRYQSAMDKNKIDLVILDLGMPGMGGRVCLSRLLDLDKEAKVVVASGYSQQAQARGIIEAGAKKFIGKPYQVINLVDEVRKVLDA